MPEEVINRDEFHGNFSNISNKTIIKIVLHGRPQSAPVNISRMSLVKLGRVITQLARKHLK